VQEEDALQKKDGQSVPKRRQQPKRRSAARLKKERPLSADPMNCAKQPARRGRKAGSKTLTRKAPPSFEDKVPCKAPPTLHTCPYVTDYVGGSECPPAADVLLLRARESVQMQTDWAGRRPCVMDVVLDLQDRARGSRMPEARVAAYAVAAVRCNYGQCKGPTYLAAPTGSPTSGPSWQRGYYTFGDQTSLARYWDNQAARWAAVRVFDDSAGSDTPVVGFPESIERSTARWTARLNCE
jgi:hypothetical protein